MKPPLLSERRSVAAALACLAFGVGPARAAAGVDYGAAIDQAGRQRMLSQRIVKAYCQVGLGVTPEASREQLAEALRLFETRLAGLRSIAPDAATRLALGRVGRAWAPFRARAAGPVSRAGAQRLHALDEAVLRASQEVVTALQNAAGTPQAALVALSGRQRMLSQRLAKLYMLRAWGLDSDALREQMTIAGNEFVDALAALKSAPENTPAIAGELESVEQQWDWFAGAISQLGQDSYAWVVADASEAILASMDLITLRYAQLARR